MRPRAGDSDFGPVCACGGPKAKQARTCQTCHGRIRGYRPALYLGVCASNGDRRRALNEALEHAHGELHKLIAQQLRDDRTVYVNQGNAILSLDAPNRRGRTLYDRVPA